MNISRGAKPNLPDRRRYFLGGSNACIIMGPGEGALLRLWRKKRGEVEPEDLSGNLIVQLGLATEPLNRSRYERNAGEAVKGVQRRVRHPVNSWMALPAIRRVASSFVALRRERMPDSWSIGWRTDEFDAGGFQR
jgi:predicted phage-related endonuclease